MSRSSDMSSRASPLARERPLKGSLVASPPSSGIISQRALNHAVPLKRLRGKHANEVAVFLLKMAALEIVRRVSKARWPVVWRVVQGLQVLGCPPFVWIRNWGPLKWIVKAVQKFSRPLLCLSVATAFLDHSEISQATETAAEDSRPESEPSESSISDIRKCDELDGTSKNIVSEDWLQRIHLELQNEGVSLPERINEDELRRFFVATRGDFSCLLSSIKRTIRWRETYYLLSSQELEKWSTLVFWHGYDTMRRPCLVIRVGVACSSLPPDDRPSFSQAVVSQIEQGILHLVTEADPRITVLIDCKGLSPIRFPMQMLKSCASILQEHYPNRLAVLFVVRLPPVSRVIMQTFIKVLKPATRQKLRIEGETYLRLLSEVLESVPAFLGGKCTCRKCRMLLAGTRGEHTVYETSELETNDDSQNCESSPDDYPVTENLFSHCEHYLRGAILGILMLCIMIAVLAGFYDPSLSLPP